MEIKLILFLIVVGAFAIWAAYEFFTMSREKQIKMVKEWLLFAVIEAEKQLGSKTGQVKLRLVYDMFLTKFKYLSMIISFEQFSDLVDETLFSMRNMIKSNEALSNYINKEENNGGRE